MVEHTRDSLAAGKAAAEAAGGIAWKSGSLMGANNPSNYGYRYSTPHKRYKYRSDGGGSGGGNGEEEEKELPSNLVVQFRNREGEDVGDQLDLPISSDADQMSSLVHALLSAEKMNDDDDDDDDDENDNMRVPYSFHAEVRRTRADGTEYVDDVEVTGTVADLVREHGLSTEDVLSLTYRPLAVFKVRPVTRCTDTMPGHTEAVLHVSFSPDGKRLASGGGDTTVRFWDTSTATPTKTCRGHKNHVLCTAWSPDGKRFASADKSGVLVAWNPTTGESTAVIKAHKKYVTGLAWEPLHRLSGRPGANRGCERLVTSSKDATLRVWNVRTRACEATLSGHLDSVECVRWGGEGLLYSASRDRTIKVWCAENDPSNNDARVGKLVRTLKGHAHRVNALAASSDHVCRTGPFDAVGAKDVDVDDPSAAVEAAVRRYRAFKSPAEPERLVSGSDDFTLYLWHPTVQKQPLKRLTGHQQLVNHISFSPDGRRFCSASFDKKTKIWDGRSGDYVATLTGHVGAVYQTTWSPDGRYLVTASKDSTAKLWDATTVESMRRAKETLPGHADEVYALDWSPTGVGGVATGSKDRTIKIWKH